MKILKNFPKLYIVNGVFCLAYILTSTLHGYLRNKSGYPITFDNGGYFVWGALIFLAFLAYSAIGLAIYYAMENKKQPSIRIADFFRKEDIIEETCDYIAVKAYPGGNPNKKQEKQSEDITH